MPRLLTIVGARPQFIKAAVVSRALAREGSIEELLLHTGQHYDENMSDVFFRELSIPPPRFSLSVGSGRHGEQTGRMLAEIENVILGERPDAALVYGDTNSTLAGALAAAKLHVPVVHVEAGLRSFQRAMPEEINRVMTDHLSDLLLAPTAAAVENLRREGIEGDQVRLVGDVMFDAAKFFARAADAQGGPGDASNDGPAGVSQGRFTSPRGGYILATVHRAENTDDPARLAAVVDGLLQVAREIPVVWPLHPRTRKLLTSLPGFDASFASDAGGCSPGESPPTGLCCIEPVGYLEMTALERGARLIVTDSGGVQKEAYFHGVPCVTLRHETEWIELVAHGWNRLVPPVDASSVAQGIRAALAAERPNAGPSLYGNGRSGEAIVEILREHMARWRSRRR